MFDAEIRFVARQQKLTGQLVEEVWSYARALRGHGQLADDYSVSRKGTQIRLLCIIPERCSLAARFHDPIGRKQLRQTLKLTTGAPVTQLTGEAEETPPYCSCRSRPSAHLFTHLFDDSTPLACGACRRAIPFYRLRNLSRDSQEALLRWQWAYQACDDLWIHSGFAERWAYGQLSRINSGLTVEGMELRAQVEKDLRLPVFYFLHRYSGRSEAAERKRRCPGCGGKWLLSRPEGLFTFRCIRCRFLSEMAVDLKSPATKVR